MAWLGSNMELYLLKEAASTLAVASLFQIEATAHVIYANKWI